MKKISPIGCVVCKKPKGPYKNKYCSDECAYKQQKLQLSSCWVCGKPRGPRRVMYCSDECLLIARKTQPNNATKLTPKTAYKQYISGAKVRLLEFKITKRQFERYWQQPCYYCGDAINTIGLDRVDNNIGYRKDNVVACCKWCNRLKSNQDVSDFIDRCKRIASRHY